MKKLALITLLFIHSCTNKVDLRGDWKAIEFMNNGVINRDFNFPITYIKSDNIIIYFDDVMFYKIKGDSMLFMAEDNLDKVISKKKIEILDVGTGSGCILIILLCFSKFSTGIGVDISKNAI